MKCLSLKQPFADLVVSGKKTIELRKWNTHYRGYFLVHASGNVDKDACAYFNQDPKALVIHAVIGKAVLYNVKKYESDEEFIRDKGKHLASDKYASSRYGFLLKDAVRFEKPIPLMGKLRFFNVELCL